MRRYGAAENKDADKEKNKMNLPIKYKFGGTTGTPL